MRASLLSGQSDWFGMLQAGPMRALQLFLEPWSKGFSLGNSLAVQWLGFCTSTAGKILIPGWGTKIRQVTWHSQKPITTATNFLFLLGLLCWWEVTLEPACRESSRRLKPAWRERPRVDRKTEYWQLWAPGFNYCCPANFLFELV